MKIKRSYKKGRERNEQQGEVLGSILKNSFCLNKKIAKSKNGRDLVKMATKKPHMFRVKMSGKSENKD